MRVEFVPAIFSRQLETIATLHFAIDRWKGREYLHKVMPDFFRFIIRKGRHRDYTSERALEAFEKYVGVPQAELTPRLKRLSVLADVNRTKRYMQYWGISSTPTFIVGGEFIVQPTRELDPDQVLEVVAYLVEKIRARKAGA